MPTSILCQIDQMRHNLLSPDTCPQSANRDAIPFSEWMMFRLCTDGVPVPGACIDGRTVCVCVAALNLVDKMFFVFTIKDVDFI